VGKKLKKKRKEKGGDSPAPWHLRQRETEKEGETAKNLRGYNKRDGLK